MPRIPLPPENAKGGCGVRRIFTKDRILSVDPGTSFGEFPWMVALYNYSGGKLTMKCGGSLISHEVVLTAAHCVYGLRKSEVIVRAGDWNLLSRAEPEKSIDRRVKEIITHEDFSPTSIINDVALLVLGTPLEKKIHIDTICLPEKGDVFSGQRCLATGWGTSIEARKKAFSPKLNKVELPVLEHKECRDLLRKTSLGRYFRLDKSFLCAGGEAGNGACAMDGGGPLVCESDSDPGRYYQVGIIAGGIACGVENVPDFYANVAYLSDWIKEALAERSLVNEAVPP